MVAGKNPRAAFHVALAYLLWSIVPHFHLLIHSHAGGAHSHAEFTGAQVRLANSVIEGLGPSGLSVGAGEIGGSENGPVRAAAEPTLASGSVCLLHAHFWEDSNLASLAWFPSFALVGAAILLFFASRYRPPSLSLPGPALARGPPFLRIA